MNQSIEELLRTIHFSSDEMEIGKAKLRIHRMLLDESEDELDERIKKSSDEVERELAERVLWRKKLDESFEGLMGVIRASRDEDKIREAAIVLGEKGYKEAVQPLINLLRTTTNSQVRDGAALGLRELADQRAMEPLVEMITRHPDDASTLVYALETLDCSAILDVLVDIFISRVNDYMLRHSVRECIKNTALSNVPVETLEMCRQEVSTAIAISDDEENSEQLEQLARALEE